MLYVGKKTDQMGEHVGQRVGGGVVQHRVWTMVGGTWLLKGEVQEWWQNHWGLSCGRQFC